MVSYVYVDVLQRRVLAIKPRPAFRDLFAQAFTGTSDVLLVSPKKADALSSDHIGCEGEDGAVLVVLGREPFWFCGVACAALSMDELCRAVYEDGPKPLFMFYNTIYDN